jgi:hypothetical protein
MVFVSNTVKDSLRRNDHRTRADVDPSLELGGEQLRQIEGLRVFEISESMR